MDILEAWKVLNEYYSRSDLDFLYKRQKFDGSETDTNKKFEYNVKILREKATKISDSDERARIYKVAEEFERVAREADSQR